MLGKQRINNLCDGNCDKTFKNLLRSQEKNVKKTIIPVDKSKRIFSG